MKQQVALFKFTLGQGQSIGPHELRALWARACQSPDVSVSRMAGVRGSDKPTYSLYGPQQLQDLPVVEQRLRDLMADSKLRLFLVPLHPH